MTFERTTEVWFSLELHVWKLEWVHEKRITWATQKLFSSSFITSLIKNFSFSRWLPIDLSIIWCFFVLYFLICWYDYCSILCTAAPCCSSVFILYITQLMSYATCYVNAIYLRVIKLNYLMLNYYILLASCLREFRFLYFVSLAFFLVVAGSQNEWDAVCAETRPRSLGW